MLPIAKAGVLLVLLGAGATGTCALAGGFGSGNGEETQKENTVEGTQKPNANVVSGTDVSRSAESRPQESTTPGAPAPQSNPGAGASADSSRSRSDQDGVDGATPASSETSRESATTDGRVAGSGTEVSSTTITTTPGASQPPNTPSEPSVTTTQVIGESA